MKLMWNTNIAAGEYDSTEGGFKIRSHNHPMRGFPVEFTLYQNTMVLEKCASIRPLLVVAERIHNSTRAVTSLEVEISRVNAQILDYMLD